MTQNAIRANDIRFMIQRVRELSRNRQSVLIFGLKPFITNRHFTESMQCLTRHQMALYCIVFRFSTYLAFSLLICIVNAKIMQGVSGKSHLFTGQTNKA